MVGSAWVCLFSSLVTAKVLFSRVIGLEIWCAISMYTFYICSNALDPSFLATKPLEKNWENPLETQRKPHRKTMENPRKSLKNGGKP